MDSPYQTAGTSFSATATRSTAKRLRRSRQHLGTYRHDLIVAMRAVNNIDREIMRAEWENWLLDENTRCKQVQMMLRENRTGISPTRRIKGADSQQVLTGTEKEKNSRLEELEDYCGSCKIEQDLLHEGRNHLAFG